MSVKATSFLHYSKVPALLLTHRQIVPPVETPSQTTESPKYVGARLS